MSLLVKFLVVMSGLSFVSASFGFADPVTRVTSTGAVFTQVTREGFGESWQDPSGLVWGDEVLSAGGVPLNLEWKQAIGYCRSVQGEFPSKEDWIRLREYMGASSGVSSGYSPQVLPHLETQSYWSQSYGSSLAYSFNGTTGAIVDYDISYNYSMNFRCVTH